MEIRSRFGSLNEKQFATLISQWWRETHDMSVNPDVEVYSESDVVVNCWPYCVIPMTDANLTRFWDWVDADKVRGVGL